MNSSEYRTMYEEECSHWWYVALHDLVIAHLPAGRGLRILDAGCGTGGLLKRMNSHGSAAGCDAAPDALAFCAVRGLKAFEADLNVGDCGKAEYDVVTLIDVIYHRNIRDDGEVLRKIYSALKPGGRLILQVPAYEWLRSSHDEAVHTARRYTRREVVNLLKACGFSIEKATYRVALLFIPVAVTRLARTLVERAGKRPGSASDVRRHSPFVNTALRLVMDAENRLLTAFSLPFGTSVFAVALKPGPKTMRGPV